MNDTPPTGHVGHSHGRSPDMSTYPQDAQHDLGKPGVDLAFTPTVGQQPKAWWQDWRWIASVSIGLMMIAVILSLIFAFGTFTDIKTQNKCRSVATNDVTQTQGRVILTISQGIVKADDEAQRAVLVHQLDRQSILFGKALDAREKAERDC